MNDYGFRDGDVKAVGGTEIVCFVYLCVTTVNRGQQTAGRYVFSLGGLNLSRPQEKEKKIWHFHAATYVN